MEDYYQYIIIFIVYLICSHDRRKLPFPQLILHAWLELEVNSSWFSISQADFSSELIFHYFAATDCDSPRMTKLLIEKLLKPKSELIPETDFDTMTINILYLNIRSSINKIYKQVIFKCYLN